MPATDSAVHLLQPQNASNAVFRVSGGIDINSTCSNVFEALIDYRNYSKWNSFVPQIIITSNDATSNGQQLDEKLGLGTKFTMTVKGLTDPFPVKNPEEIVEFIKDKKIVWNSQILPSALQTASRTHLLSPIIISTTNSNGITTSACRYETYED